MEINTYDPKYYYLQEIFISEIIFDESESVTIFGYLPDQKNDELVRWDFLCSFSLLTDILLFANEQGDYLIKTISEKLSTKLEIPTVIEVESVYGKPLIIDSLIFQVYKPYEKENGVWQPVDDTCVVIDSIESKEKFLFEKSEKYISKLIDGEITTDLLDEALGNLKQNPNEEQLSDYLIILDNAFKYYLQLFKKDFTEKESRKRSGLNDELLYRIAFFNNKIINNN